MVTKIRKVKHVKDFRSAATGVLCCLAILAMSADAALPLCASAVDSASEDVVRAVVVSDGDAVVDEDVNEEDVYEEEEVYVEEEYEIDSDEDSDSDSESSSSSSKKKKTSKVKVKTARNGTAQKTWLTRRMMEEAGYDSSAEFADAVIAACQSMNGASYSQWEQGKVDCITYVNLAYAQALGEVSDLKYSGRVTFTGSVSGGKFGLHSATGTTCCQTWAHESPHYVGSGGVRFTNEADALRKLGARKGDIILLGNYENEYEWEYELMDVSCSPPSITQETGWFDSGLELNLESESSTLIVRNARFTGNIREVSGTFRWRHIAIYAGQGSSYVYDSRSSKQTAGMILRSDGSMKKGSYNRMAVLHYESFTDDTVKNLTLDVTANIKSAATPTPDATSVTSDGTSETTAAAAKYSLAGASYALYSDSTLTNQVKTFTLNESGTTDTYSWDYSDGTELYLVCKNPGTGFSSDSSVYKITYVRGENIVTAERISGAGSGEPTVSGSGSTYTIKLALSNVIDTAATTSDTTDSSDSSDLSDTSDSSDSPDGSDVTDESGLTVPTGYVPAEETSDEESTVTTASDESVATTAATEAVETTAEVTETTTEATTTTTEATTTTTEATTAPPETEAPLAEANNGE